MNRKLFWTKSTMYRSDKYGVFLIRFVCIPQTVWQAGECLFSLFICKLINANMEYYCAMDEKFIDSSSYLDKPCVGRKVENSSAGRLHTESGQYKSIERIS